jgi:hypothetical protein
MITIPFEDGIEETKNCYRNKLAHCRRLTYISQENTYNFQMHLIESKTEKGGSIP